MKTLPSSGGLRYVGLRYMTRFHCLGADCEDACCGEWAVTVDSTRAALLRRVLPEFADVTVQRTDDEQREVVCMVQRPDKTCAMLDADRLCGIQRRYGEALLPDDCAVYPRSVGQIGGRVELSGTLSCPEVARLCLLGEDATDFVPVDPVLVTRGLVHYTYADSPKDVSEAVFDDVRDLARELLAARQFDLDSRLFFLAAFFDSASLLLRPGAGPRAAVHFRALVQTMRQPEAQAQLRAQFLAAPRDAFAASAVSQVVGAMQRRSTDSLRRLFGEVLGPLARDPGSGVCQEPDGAFSFSPQEFAASSDRRRVELPAAFLSEEDALLERLCQNHLVRMWPLWSADLRAYGFGLFLRLAIVRFFLRHHPLVAGSGGDREKIRTAAVQVVYTLSRIFDHEGTILRTTCEYFTEHELDTLPNAVSLLKF